MKRPHAAPLAIAAGLTIGIFLPAFAGDSVAPVPFLGSSASACQPGAPCANTRTHARPSPKVVIGNAYPKAHIVTEPGRYGLSEAPPGEAYAVIGRSLTRIDKQSHKVLSILRQIEGLRD